MADVTTRTRARRRWRSLGLAFAFALGIAAVVVVVLANTQRQQTIGLLIGLWAALVGFFLGPRRGGGRDAAASSESRELELRRHQELARERDAAERREYELRLQAMLRRDMEEVFRGELAQLRDEIAALRSDVVEKASGQVKVERIETTRLSGPDLEALRQEVRRLAVQDVLAVRQTGVRDVVESAQTPQLAPADHVTAPVEPPPATAPPAEPAAPAAPNLPIGPDLPSENEAEATPHDPLAGLPRLGRFDHVGNEPGSPDERGVGLGETPDVDRAPASGTAAATHQHQHQYVGRRRLADGDTAQRRDGRPATPRGGRRRRADGETNEVLARLLGRS